MVKYIGTIHTPFFLKIFEYQQFIELNCDKLASKKALWETIAVIIVVIIVAVSAYYITHLKVSG